MEDKGRDREGLGTLVHTARHIPVVWRNWLRCRTGRGHTGEESRGKHTANIDTFSIREIVECRNETAEEWGKHRDDNM